MTRCVRYFGVGYVLLFAMCFILGCNITPKDEACTGPMPQCQCSTAVTPTCQSNQWVCACTGQDMTNMLDMPMDAQVDQPIDQPVDMIDMPDDMALPSCDTLDKSSLPTGWTSLDVQPYGPGRVGFNGKEFCVEVASVDIWGRADSFHYVYQEAQGDVDIRARILNFKGVHPFTKVGVMIRQDASDKSPMATTYTTTDWGEQFAYRPLPGYFANSYDDQTKMRRGFVWVRLVRRGQWVVGLTSEDGRQWTRIGQIHMPTLSNKSLVGLAVSSHDEKETYASFDQVSISKPDDAACPMALDCPDLFEGADEARVGGLLVSLFGRASRFDVTNTNDGGQGSLRWAIEQANAQPGYSIIEVAPSLKGQTILIETSLPAVERTWLKGNGVIVSGAMDEPLAYNTCRNTDGCVQRPTAFTLKSLSILEGFVIRHVQFGVFSRSSGTGIWVHHNTFEYCTNVYADLSGNKDGQRRYITISDNQFIGSTMGQDSKAAIFQTCAPQEANCDDDPTNMFISMHHNYFGPKMSRWFPAGGVKLLYYNNFFDNVSSMAPLVDLRGIGEALSQRNMLRTMGETVLFGDGLVQSQDDFFYGPGMVGATMGMVSFMPMYHMPLHLKQQSIENQAKEQSGAPR